MLEKNGVKIAAVSYDSEEKLRDFRDKHGIGFPLLSDRDSAVIRSFGIFNTNIAPDLRAYGVPHPVEYLVAPDGIVIRKYFVENYQHRVTAAEVALREFGETGGDAPAATIRSGALTVEIALSSAHAFAGQEVGYAAKFTIEPAWHIYGAPSPSAYTPTSIIFDDPKIIRQTLDLPAPSLLNDAALGETIPVYSGSFDALGSLLLKFPMDAGEIKLSGRLRFQQCSDTVCEAPQSIPFELPLTLRVFVDAERTK